MSFLEIKKEIKAHNKNDSLTKMQREVLEREIFQDLKKQYGKCQKCWRTENLNLDHIIPRDILKMFGMDVDREILEGNYSILCRPCNTFKGNKLDFSNPKTKELLLKLVERI